MMPEDRKTLCDLLDIYSGDEIIFELMIALRDKSDELLDLGLKEKAIDCADLADSLGTL